MNIYNFGSINIDYVYKVNHFVKPGETLACSSVTSFAGGKGYNQTIALARAGASVKHIGTIGSDGRGMVETLTQEGVDVSNIAVVPDLQTGHAIIQVVPDGQNSIIVAAGANFATGREFVEKALKTASSKDFLLVQNETSCVAEAIEIARQQNVKVALNPSPMDKKILELPLDKVDCFLVNEEEAFSLSGFKDAPESVLGKLHLQFPDACVIMTLGSDGVIAIEPTGAVSRADAYKVNAVDTTAAGDTFTGYFLASVTNGESVKEALEIASAAAAISVTRPGASPSIPYKKEVLDWLRMQRK